MKLLPFQGALLAACLPRALPWAKSFCPFRACGAKLQLQRQKYTIFDFFKWTQINSFTYLMAPIISCTDEQP